MAENRQKVTITVEDGTQAIKNIVIGGNIKSLPFVLYDNGTNGDAVAGDHIWSRSLDLNEGNYNWEVYSRKISTRYDTTTTVGSDGTITQVLTPVTINNDSLLSEGLNLSLTVANKTITGDTLFSYRNNTVVFILNMAGYISQNPDAEIQPYLMGIKDNWSDGLAMSPLSSNNWVIAVGGYNIGDEIDFSFRNGDYWENNSPVTRKHTVSGNDTLYFAFAENITSAAMLDIKSRVKLFPNPASETITIETSENFNVVETIISDVFGRTVITKKGSSTSVNISALRKGSYIVRIKNEKGMICQTYFLKK